ncbi:MAG: LamG-like jellyroll fold domain-containing protein [Synechococcus sp.]
MTFPATISSPKVRGVATVRVIDQDGETRQEVRADNITMGPLWDGVFFRQANDISNFMSSSTTYYPHLYISDTASKPTPYETSVLILGEGTDHPTGAYFKDKEPVTQTPFFEFHNLFTVTGSSRTVYSIGLIGRVAPGARTNDYGTPTSKLYPLTRALLPEAVIQGPTDQLDITYRLYVEQEPGQLPSAGFWCYVLDWAFTRTGSAGYGTDRTWEYRKLILGTSGVGNTFTQGTINLPTYTAVSSTNTTNFNWTLRESNFNTTRVNNYNRVNALDDYRWGWRLDTDRDFMWGFMFNEWWGWSYDARASDKAWLGETGWDQLRPGADDGVIWGESRFRTSYTYTDATALSSPFKNSYSHSPTSMLMVYDINGLPTTTWRATFGGTWPSTDRVGLWSRLWWSEGGALDGTAKYKMTFCRTFGNVRGLPLSETNQVWGYSPTGTKGQSYNDDGENYAGRTAPAGMQWTRKTDLSAGHTEYENSRFGNLGFENRNGWHGREDNRNVYGTEGQPDINRRKLYWNPRKYPGLTMNTWWGFQGATKGKSAYLGVEWRQMEPFQRVVWQASDIDPALTRIDYLEPVAGIPGEVDEEMALICDSTSGIYLLNATQNTVTKITGETGFVQCSTNREADGSFTYTGIKRHDDPDYRVTLHDQHSGYGGTEESQNTRYWQGLPAGTDGRRHVIYPLKNLSPQVGGAPEQDLSDEGHSVAFVGNDIRVREATYGGFMNCISFNQRGTSYANWGSYLNVSGDGIILPGDFTIECWYWQQQRDGGSGDCLFELSNYNSAGNGILVRMSQETNAVYTSGTARGRIFSDNTVGYRKWSHFCMERVGSTVTIYINGESRLSFTDSNTINANGDSMYIGDLRHSTSTQSFEGHISQFRISAVARYNGNVVPPLENHPIGAADPQWSSVKLLLRGYGESFGTITGGGDYANGNHTVALTGGTGTDATAYVRVTGGAVDRVAIIDGGGDYTIGDVLTGAVPGAPNPDAGAILTTFGPVFGSGYADGDYPGVLLTGGTGTGATATLSVTGGGVTDVTITDGGQDYTAGDTLSAPDSALGNLGTGAGFTVEVATVDENAELTPTPWSITLETLRTPAPVAWVSDGTTNQGQQFGYGYNSDQLVQWRRHYRFPHIGAGNSTRTVTDYQVQAWVQDFRYGLHSVDATQRGRWTSNTYVYPESEQFGYTGEDQSGTEAILMESMRAKDWIRLIPPHWISFTPDGNWCRIEGQYMWYHTGTHGAMFCTRYALNGFGLRSWSSYHSKPLCTSPHSLQTIPNHADPAHPHYVNGDVNGFGTVTNGGRSFSTNVEYRPWIFKGMSNDVTPLTPGDAPPYEKHGQPLTVGYNNNTQNADSQGYGNLYDITRGQSYASEWDHLGNGALLDNGVETYKGLSVNGQTAMFNAPLFCERTPNLLTDSYWTYPETWPTDPINDAVLLNPFRWDTWGWDDANSTWVREEWAWDYDTKTWHVDPATVFPGRPAPTGGGTHNLDGVTLYPYNNLTVTFEDQRPELSVNPSLEEWSSQYIYNGEVMDGVREYSFSGAMSARPMIRGAINQTVPASGVITIPESFDDRFKKLDHYDYNLHSLKLDGVSADLLHVDGLAGPAVAGTIESTRNQLIFHADDIGKTVSGSYVFTRYADTESPANWCRVKVERDEIVASSPNDLLGGQAYKDTAVLVSEGWTQEGTGNATHYVSATDYAAEFPTGFRVRSASSSYELGTSAEVLSAERIAFQADAIAWHWTDASTAVGTGHYGQATNNGPTYGTVQWMYNTNLAMVDLHSRLYTDASLVEWLVIRGQWYFSSGTNYVVMELWINTEDPWQYEARHGTWGTVSNTDTPGNQYQGIVMRTNGSGGFVEPTIYPTGTHTNRDYISDVDREGKWQGGPDQWSGVRWQLNFNNLGLST